MATTQNSCQQTIKFYAGGYQYEEQKKLVKTQQNTKVILPQSQSLKKVDARKTFSEVKTGNGYCVEKTRESTTDNLTVGLQFHFASKV